MGRKMQMESVALEKEFLDYVKKMSAYEEALSVIYWDLRTGAPKNGVDQRSQVIGVLSSEVFSMSVSEQMAEYIDKIAEDRHASEVARKTAMECKKVYERNKKIPADEYREYVILQSKAESIWEEAKNKSDFEMFRPYLEKLVETTKRFIGYWGYSGNKYNTLLDMYEPGVTVEVLDKVFGQLREQIVPLVKQISDSADKPKTDFLFKHFPKEKQRAFSEEILRQMGYNFDAGRLDETVHPFAIGINPGDVRVTTKFDEKILGRLYSEPSMKEVMPCMSRIFLLVWWGPLCARELQWASMNHSLYFMKILSAETIHSGRKIMSCFRNIPMASLHMLSLKTITGRSMNQSRR